MHLIYSGKHHKIFFVIELYLICFIHRYIYTYIEYIKDSASNDKYDENNECFKPRTVYLERTGTIKVITISALISHFLPYFNSSINPIIYNIMSGNNHRSNFFFFFVLT